MSDKRNAARSGQPDGGEQGRGNVLPYYTLINWYRSIDWVATIRHFPHNLRRLARIKWDEWQMRDIRRYEELYGPPDCFPPAVPTLWQQAAHAEGALYWWDIHTQDDFDKWMRSGSE